MRALLLALLLAVPLSAQEPDSIITETRTSVPMPATAPNPAPVVNLTVEQDSIVAVMREMMADQAVREAFAQCGCTGEGIPERVYWGALAVATFGLILWSRKEVETVTIHNSQTQDQTTTVTTRRGKWRKKPHGEEE